MTELDRGTIGRVTLVFDPVGDLAGMLIPEEYLEIIELAREQARIYQEVMMATGRFHIDVSGQIQELRDVKQSLISLRDRVDAVIESLKTVQVDFIPDPPP